MGRQGGRLPNHRLRWPRLVDFRLGYGPIILGYQDRRVDNAVVETIQTKGTISGFSTLLDTAVVKTIKAMCPNIEKVRFANSGTEAVMGALRTARGFTNRQRVVIVEGGFHGLTDEMMWKSDVEGWDPAGQTDPDIIPFGAGIPAQTRGLVDFLPLNDHHALESLFAAKGDDIAAVLLEPIMGNCGSISATPEWLQTLRETTANHGAMLIIDEVKTGFRVAKGGAQELYGIHADLTTYAKAMGNGYPVACFGGRADVMDVIGAGGGVVHGGPTPRTWWPSPLPRRPSTSSTAPMHSRPSTEWERRYETCSAASSPPQALPISLPVPRRCSVFTSATSSRVTTATGA